MLGEVKLLPPLSLCEHLKCALIVVLASCSLAQRSSANCHSSRHTSSGVEPLLLAPLVMAELKVDEERSHLKVLKLFVMCCTALLLSVVLRGLSAKFAPQSFGK